MINKRQIKAPPKMASATTMPIWKQTPKGDEQKELERMFRAGQINAKSTPDSVRRKNETFMKFSPPVFGVHFRKTKAKFGLSAAIPGEDAGPSSVIPELGAGSSIQSFFEAENEPEPPEPEHQSIEFRNAPFWTWSYTDHVKKLDFVCVALPIISGSRDIKFIISEDGMQLRVEYTWPLAMLQPENLFAEAKANDVKITNTHPKWHAFLSNLLEFGLTQNSKPRGAIIINLPKQIKRESGTWKKEAIHDVGTQIILLEFSAYQKAVIIEDDDTSIVF